jgi:hypothetical protein
MAFGPMAFGPMAFGPMAFGPMAFCPMAFGPMAFGPMAFGPMAFGQIWLVKHISGQEKIYLSFLFWDSTMYSNFTNWLIVIRQYEVCQAVVAPAK